MSKGVYLIQPAIALGTSRLKIGYSAKSILNRIKSYGKETCIYKMYECDNPRLLEKKIIDEFKKNYESKIGNEYFDGDINKMIVNFSNICENYGANQFNSQIIESNIIYRPPKFINYNNKNYKLTFYDRSDCLKNYKIGTNKDRSEDDIIKEAITNNNFLVVKAGKNALWYIKGNKNSIKDIEYYKTQLQDNIGKNRKNSYSILIEECN